MEMKRSKTWALGLVGAAAIIVGCLLPWLDTGGVNVGGQPVAGDPAGLDTTYGMAVLVAGIAAAVASLLLLLIPRATRLWAVIVLLAGGVAVAAGVLTLTSPRETYTDYVVSQVSVPQNEMELTLEALYESGGLQEEFGPGVYVVVAGGGLALLTGLVGLIRGRRPRRTTPIVVAEAPDSVVVDGPVAVRPEETPEADTLGQIPPAEEASPEAPAPEIRDAAGTGQAYESAETPSRSEDVKPESSEEPTELESPADPPQSSSEEPAEAETPETAEEPIASTPDEPGAKPGQEPTDVQDWR
jgi:hypothetical protein